MCHFGLCTGTLFSDSLGSVGLARWCYGSDPRLAEGSRSVRPSEVAAAGCRALLGTTFLMLSASVGVTFLHTFQAQLCLPQNIRVFSSGFLWIPLEASQSSAPGLRLLTQSGTTPQCGDRLQPNSTAVLCSLGSKVLLWFHLQWETSVGVLSFTVKIHHKSNMFKVL